MPRNSSSVQRLAAKDLSRVSEILSLFSESADSETFLESSDNIFLAAEIGGEPAGFLIGYILPRWDGKPPMLFLYSIDVLEKHRRRGIGRKLVCNFLEIGTRAGCGKGFVVTNQSNVPAMKLYEAAGGQRMNADDVLFEFLASRS